MSMAKPGRFEESGKKRKKDKREREEGREARKKREGRGRKEWRQKGRSRGKNGRMKAAACAGAQLDNLWGPTSRSQEAT